MRLISREYYDFNPTHLAEELVKLYDIRIAAQTLRRWMKQETLRALSRVGNKASQKPRGYKTNGWSRPAARY